MDTPDSNIIAFFQHCLREAERGRVLFVVASVGLVGEPVAQATDNAPLILYGDSTGTRHEVANDEKPPPRKFSVSVGCSMADNDLHPATLTSAFEDVVRGSRAAERAIAEEIVKRQPAAVRS